MAISTPEDAVAAALRQIGYARTVVDLYDGSLAAKVALDYYDQTRDEVQRSQDWPFAMVPLTLTLLKGPPPPGGYTPLIPWSNIYPPPGWLYEYAYPSDCLEMCAIIKQPGPMPTLLPHTTQWQIFNDEAPVLTLGNPAPPNGSFYPVYNPNDGSYIGANPTAGGSAARAIASNTANAVGVYRRRISDLTLWEPLAIETFVLLLGEKLAKDPRIAGSPDYAKMLPTEAAVAEAATQGHPG